jgi:hypothetical protein
MIDKPTNIQKNTLEKEKNAGKSKFLSQILPKLHTKFPNIFLGSSNVTFFCENFVKRSNFDGYFNVINGKYTYYNNKWCYVIINQVLPSFLVE